MIYAGIFFLLCFIILFMYDYVKDILRVLSGYGNILNGSSNYQFQGSLKVMGYTRSNIIRKLSFLGLFILIIASGYFSRKLRLLSNDEIPDDIKIQIVK